jgi:hypothetical protein
MTFSGDSRKLGLLYSVVSKTGMTGTEIRRRSEAAKAKEDTEKVAENKRVDDILNASTQGARDFTECSRILIETMKGTK